MNQANHLDGKRVVVLGCRWKDLQRGSDGVGRRNKWRKPRFLPNPSLSAEWGLLILTLSASWVSRQEFVGQLVEFNQGKMTKSTLGIDSHRNLLKEKQISLKLTIRWWNDDATLTSALSRNIKMDQQRLISGHLNHLYFLNPSWSPGIHNSFLWFALREKGLK